MSTMLIAGALTANAQSKEKTVYEFQPHWYVGVQGGAQYTLGEVSFGDLISPTAQVLVGYNFSKVVGLRLGVNAWQSKAGLTGNYGLASTPFEYIEVELCGTKPRCYIQPLQPHLRLQPMPSG